VTVQGPRRSLDLFFQMPPSCAISVAIAAGSSAVLAVIGLLWYTKSLNAQKLEEELANLRMELAKVSRQPCQIQPSEQEQELKQQVENLRTENELAIAEKKSFQVSMAEEKEMTEQATRVVSEAKIAAEHARDELIAENHKLCTQLSAEQTQNQNHQETPSKNNLTTEQLRDQNLRQQDFDTRGRGRRSLLF